MDDASSDFILLKIEVTKRHPDEVRRLRKEHRRKKNDAQAHHIIPLSLGGTNATGNICMLSPEEHHDAHRIIDEQISDLAVGERRTIELPYPVSRVGSDKGIRKELRKEFIEAGYELVHITTGGHEVYRKGKDPIILPPEEPEKHQYDMIKRKLNKKEL